MQCAYLRLRGGAMKLLTMSPLWILFPVMALLLADGYMQAQEDAAKEAYRLQVVAQKKAAQDKAFNDLAARGEFMTGFKAAVK